MYAHIGPPAARLRLLIPCAPVGAELEESRMYAHIGPPAAHFRPQRRATGAPAAACFPILTFARNHRPACHCEAPKGPWQSVPQCRKNTNCCVAALLAMTAPAAQRHPAVQRCVHGRMWDSEPTGWMLSKHFRAYFYPDKNVKYTAPFFYSMKKCRGCLCSPGRFIWDS